MSRSISEEWKKVRDARPEKDNGDRNGGDSGVSLYERLKEQKRKEMEQELEEAKASNAVRVIEKEDLEFFEQVEEAKRAQEEQVRREVESQVHQFALRKHHLQVTSSSVNPVHPVRVVPPSTPSASSTSSASVSRQRSLLRGAILKGKKSSVEKRVSDEE